LILLRATPRANTPRALHALVSQSQTSIHYFGADNIGIASKTSNAIQAAECAYNTRVSGKQTFAIFKVDHQYDKNNGAPYGTCEAYECDAPASGELTADADYWTFFWR
jgi:hypothetical protein